MYGWLLFGHLLGVGLLIGGVGAYALSVEHLRRVRTVEDVRLLLRIAGLGERLLIAGGLLLIVAGLTLAARFWSLAQSWIAASIALLVLYGLWTLMVEARMRRLRAAADRAPSAAMGADLWRAARDPLLPVANRVAAAVIIEILFLMTVKPAWAGIVWSFLVAAGGTALACLPLLARRARALDGTGDRAPGGDPGTTASPPIPGANGPAPEPGDDPNHGSASRSPATPGIIPLRELRRTDSLAAGAKAATLGEARR